MGAVVTKLMRPFRRFNIDNRARKIISKDKPTPAPKPAASIKQLKVAQELNPNFLENHNKKDLKLDDYLKSVYVTSTDTKAVTFSKSSDRPLPQSRMAPDFEFGFYMPDSTTEGRCTLKQIFDIIVNHKDDSVKYNANFLAAQYKLDNETVEKLLNYYKLYNLIMPTSKESEEEIMEKEPRTLLEYVNTIKRLEKKAKEDENRKCM